MIRNALHAVRHDAGMFARFVIVGGLSTLINLGLYALFSRVLFPGGDKVIESAPAFLLSVLFNFAAHRAWTYRGEKTNLSQLFRYVLVVGTSTLLQTSLFWLGHDWFGFYDIAVVLADTAITAVFTFFAHKSFTFAPAKTPVS